MNSDILEDVLLCNLSVVFCGTAAGRASAEAESYYAHSNNKFWAVLAETGLTDRRLKPYEFREVVKFGIGLTDLCKDCYGSDREVKPKPVHCEALTKKITAFEPKLLAFTSHEAGRRYLGRKTQLGLQASKIANTGIYVLPSTSLMAAWNWEATKNHWYEFARLARL